MLVFLAVEGAGAIDEVTARAQGGPNVAHNVPAHLRALLHQAWRPLADGTLVLAKHPLARTGHVRGHNVEAALQRCEVGAVSIGHNHPWVPPFRQILGQNLRALPQRFVGHQQGIVGQKRAPQRTLTARGCAEVEHALRHDVHRPISLLNKHRRGLLHIEGASVEQGIGGKRRTLGQVRSCSAPRHGLHVGIEVGGRLLERVPPNADHGRRREGLSKGLRLRGTEDVGHLLVKERRDCGHGQKISPANLLKIAGF